MTGVVPVLHYCLLTYGDDGGGFSQSECLSDLTGSVKGFDWGCHRMICLLLTYGDDGRGLGESVALADGDTNVFEEMQYGGARGSTPTCDR